MKGNVFGGEESPDKESNTSQPVLHDPSVDGSSFQGSLHRDISSQEKPPRSKRRRKDPPPKSFVGENHLQRPVNQKGSRIRVGLVNQSLWETFNALTTEMLVNKRGRRMFPAIEIVISGLIPTSTYIIAVDVVPLDNWRYKFLNGRWVASRPSAFTHFNDCYVHPLSPATGKEWMERDVSFSSLKLTNSVTLDDVYVRVATMHHYQPRLHIVESSSVEDLPPEKTHTFLLPSTTFFPVTSYMNEKIIDLKIQHNKYAKGFQAGREYKKKQFAMSHACHISFTLCNSPPSEPQSNEENSQLTEERLPNVSPLQFPEDDGETLFSSNSSTFVPENRFSVVDLLSPLPTVTSTVTDSTNRGILPTDLPHPISPTAEGTKPTHFILPLLNLKYSTDEKHSQGSGHSSHSTLSSPISHLSSPLSSTTSTTCSSYPISPVMSSQVVNSCPVGFTPQSIGSVLQISNVLPTTNVASTQDQSWRPVYLAGFHHFRNSPPVAERGQPQIQPLITQHSTTEAAVVGTTHIGMSCTYPVPMQTSLPSYLPTLPNPVSFAAQGNASGVNSWKPFIIPQIPQLQPQDPVSHRRTSACHFQLQETQTTFNQ
jgi:hypothetical protein